MSLSGQQRKKLQDALIDAFPNTASLEQMLSFELDKNLRVIAGEGSLQDIVFKLIQTANSQGWVEDLVRAACDSNPGNPLLKTIAQKFLTNHSQTLRVTSSQIPLKSSAQQHEPIYPQNLVRYQQAFSEAIEREFPLSEPTRCQLKQLQESLQLKEKEVLQIEQPIVFQKSAEYRKQQERIRQQRQTEKQLQQPSTLQPSRSLVIEFDTATVNTQGEITVQQRSKVRYRAEDLDNGLGLQIVLIPPGRFMMGSPDSEVGRQIDESPQHQVTVAAFLMSKYPITQAQWTLVANLPKVNLDLEPYPCYFTGEKLPVEGVSWYEAVEFCARLSRGTERAYRLPSEAEWEYACRANTVTPFHFGQIITTELANFNGQSVDGSALKREYRRETTEVGYFQYANAFGLYDMHGNVGEWCLDNWHENYEDAPINGSAWTEGGDNRYRVLRGGCWSLYAKYCRSANRSKSEPDKKSNRIGFRVVCSSGRISK